MEPVEYQYLLMDRVEEVAEDLLHQLLRVVVELLIKAAAVAAAVILIKMAVMAVADL